MEAINLILDEIHEVMGLVNEVDIDKSLNFFTKKKRIFISGAGRSGFQAKGFAMRLMHIGYTDFVLGETITPSIKKDDLWVAISGSGTTKNIVSDTESAKKLGLDILVLTSDPNSKLAHIANHVILVPGATKTGAGIKSNQLLSSLFDQSVHIILDALILKLSERDKITSDVALNNHTNIE